MIRTKFAAAAVLLVLTLAGCKEVPDVVIEESSAPAQSICDAPPVISTPEIPRPSDPNLSVPEGWRDNGIFSDYYPIAYEKLLSMSEEEKVGQVLLARCPESGGELAARDYHLGGYVLFGRDFKDRSKDQVTAELASYQQAAGIALLLAVDEEGGEVVRVSANPQLRDKPFSSPHDIYEAGGLKAIAADAVEKAELLRSLGLNLNLAPVADVSTDPKDYIYDRTLGEPADEVKLYVGEVVEETQKHGVSSALKHFPGYGNNRDTHTGAVVDDRPYMTFMESDFVPFRYGIKAGARVVLVSHNIVTSMDEERPASLSRAAHQILREELSFTGVVLSDDLAMEGARATPGVPLAVEALNAGNDMMIVTDYAGAYADLLTALENGTVSQETLDHAVFRVLAMKYASGVIK